MLKSFAIPISAKLPKHMTPAAYVAPGIDSADGEREARSRSRHFPRRLSKPLEHTVMSFQSGT